MNKFFSIVLGLMLLALAVYLIWLLSSATFAVFGYIYKGALTLEPAIYVPLAITLTTAVLGLVATLITQTRNRRWEIKSAYRLEKQAVYLEFLQMIAKIMLAQKPEFSDKKIDDRKLVEMFIKLRTEAIVWSSQEVLVAISEFTSGKAKSPKEMILILDRLQRAMRKDLGHQNWKLPSAFFAKLYLNDPSEFDKL